MPYVKTEIYSGDVYEAVQCFRNRTQKKFKRGKVVGETSEKQKGINSKYSQRNLSRKINANFSKGDTFITLTYEGNIPDIDTAKRNLKNFIRRVQYYRKKNGLPDLKYITVTEHDGKRIHHHIIMSAMSLDTLNEIWGEHGRINLSKIYTNADHTGLAVYLTKEPSAKFKKRWTQSRNLDKPYIKPPREIKNGNRPLKAPKGYRIVEQEYNYNEWSQTTQYIRAVKIGGMDYGLGLGQGITTRGSGILKKPNTPGEDT